MFILTKENIIDKIRLFLLLLFTVTLPNSVAVNNLSWILLTIFWIFFGDKKYTFNLIKNNPLIFFSYLLYFSYIVSLLWSDDLRWGLHILKKELIFLFLPILISLIKNEEKEFLLKSFIVSMTLSEIISYLVFFKIIPPIFHATSYEPTPFMNHVSYNPFLAITIYLLLFYTFLDKTITSKSIKLLSAIFIVTMTVNIFITGGRAGQVAFFVVISLFIFQKFKINWKSLLLIPLILISIFYLAYTFSPIFKNRVNLAVKELKSVDENPNTSVGLRVTFAKNTIKIINSNPILGVGVGDYPKEYKRVNKKNTPKAKNTIQPHNMYLFVWASSGILGLFSLISLLFVQLLSSINSNSKYRYIMLVIPIFFAVIMLSDSYLLGHHTTKLFIFLSAIFYGDVSWRIFRSNENINSY